MAGKIKGITLEIGGDTTGLSKALSDVNKKTRDVQSELRAVDKALKLDPKNTEILAQKQKLLAESISNTGDKLKALEKAKKEADKRMANGDTSTSEEQYRALQREISNTRAELKKLESQSKDTNKAMSEATSGSKKTGKGFGDLKATFGVAAKGAAVFGGAVIAAGAALSEIEESTREYREDLRKLETAFTSAGKSPESAKKAYSGFFGILGESDRAIEAVNHLAELTKNEKELAEWTNIAAGVNAKFTDSLPIEGLTEAANETAKVGQVTGVLADALNWAGESEEKFNEKLEKLNTEEERAALITETLSGLYSQTGQEYMALNSEIIATREAQQKWNDSMANIGEAVAPAKAAITSYFAEFVNGTANFIKSGGFIEDETANLIVSSRELCDEYRNTKKAIDDRVLSELAQLEMIEDLVHELDGLVDSEGNVDEANRTRAEYIMGELNSALGTELEWNEKLRDSLDDVVEGIDAVVQKRQAEALLSGADEKYNELFQKRIDLGEKQKELYQELVEADSDFNRVCRMNSAAGERKYQELVAQYEEITQNVKDCDLELQAIDKAYRASAEGNTQGVIDALSKMGQAFLDVEELQRQHGENAKQIAAQDYADAVSAAEVAATNYNNVQSEANRQALEDALAHAENMKQRYIAVGGSIVDGIIEGIDGVKIKIKTKIDNLCNMLPEWAKDMLDVNSPSKVFRDKVGKPIGEGLAVGIEESEKVVKSAVSKLVDSTKKSFTDKSAFDIHSPARWSEKIGKWIDEGLANGIFENIDMVQKSFKDLFNTVEEEHEDLTREEEKYNSELERIRAAGTEKANKAYLDGLKLAAETAKKQREEIRDTYEVMVKDVEKSISTLEKDMDSYKKGMLNFDLATKDDVLLFRLNGEDFKETQYNLADLSEKVKEAEQFYKNIQQLKSMGIDDVMLQEIKNLGGNQGGILAQALLDASPEQRNKFIDDFKYIGEMSGAVTAEVFEDELSAVGDNVKGLLNELNPDLLKAGETWGYLLGSGLVSKLKEVLSGFGSIASDVGRSTSIGYNIQINQTIGTATPETAYNSAEQVRRAVENLGTQVVLS